MVVIVVVMVFGNDNDDSDGGTVSVAVDGLKIHNGAFRKI